MRVWLLGECALLVVVGCTSTPKHPPPHQNNGLPVDALGYEGHPDSASGAIIDRAWELSQEMPEEDR